MDVEIISIDKNLKKVFDATPVAMVLSGIDGKFEYVNPALLKMLGYEENEIYNDNIIISHPDDIPLSNAVRAKLRAEPFSPIVVEKRYLHKSGKVIPGILTIVAEPDENGGIRRFIGQIVDLTERKKTEDALHLFRTLINQSNDCMFVIDPKSGRFLDVNEKVCDSLGYTFDEILELTVIDIEAVMPDYTCWQEHVEEMRSSRSKIMEGEHRRKDGSTYPVEVSISYVEQENGEYIVALVRDISERKVAEEMIWKQANFDSLTRLPNRAMFHDRLQQAIKKVRRSGEQIAVLSLDLDNFKDVNDTFGHAFGDKLLVETARRLSMCVRESDTIARMGGDEFAIIMSDLKGCNSVERVCNEILAALSAPFFLGVNRAYVSSSIGIAFYPKDAKSVDTLLKYSDQAMYEAKNSGRNRHHYFTQSLQEKTEARMWLCQELRDSVSLNQYKIEYQPIVNLNTGSIHRAEALLRWNHPEHGLIGPSTFIPVAEENGMITQIGEWIFEESMRQVKLWRDEHYSDFQISVNMSPVQFRNNVQSFLTWGNQLSSIGLSGEAIIVEITEGVMMDCSTIVNDALLLLRDMGIQVAVDDFGTGYSSLSYLKTMDIDYLKIDKSFVSNLNEKPDDIVLCEAIIVMAHKLNLKVIAEGVETKQQADMLAQAGCDYGQGFFFSSAVPANDFEGFLKNKG